MTPQELTTAKKLERKESNSEKGMCVDGNWAVAHVSYRTNDCAFIFPITPSSPMGEEVDAWAEQHKKNLWGQELKVVEMQSEGGAAGALHGALVSGSLATTYTASQGLLLFIPNLYKIAGELLPTVIHVASRALAGEALSIYGDHSDTMLIRGCGLAMISSFGVQEAHDMAVITQVATLNSRIPFLHFMDGFRTSHEVNKIRLVSDEQLRELLPWDRIEEHRQRALSPMHPTQRGTAQAPDVFMQMVESSNQYYNAVEGHITKALDDFERVTGRKYSPLEYRYYGTTEPRVAIIIMGSGVVVVNGTLRHLKSETACLIGVRMYRPWNRKLLCDLIPKSVNRIAVLDRTREGGSQGEPLYLDVCTSLMQEGRGNVIAAGGRYGLGSKDFTPRMVSAIIQNMLRKNENIQRPFTVGINDDVTNLSLPMGRPINILDPSVVQCVFWGFGSDGTVGANKEAIKMIGNYHEKMSVQAYFEYDAKKSSGWTISHLRFSPDVQIEAPFRVEDGQGDYVACHNESYVQANKYDVIRFCKRRGTFFLNTAVAAIQDSKERMETLEQIVSPKILRNLALKNIKFYIMDAVGLSRKFGLAGRINMICMCVFFRLSGVLPLDDAVALLKASIKKSYGHKGDEVVRKNIDLLDAVVSDRNTLIEIEIPDYWKKISNGGAKPYEDRHNMLLDDEKTRKFMVDIADPVNRLEGDDIPVSKFLENHLLGGVMVTGTTKYEKRNPNPSGKIPKWNLNDCTQCNACIFICPHAAIRPFIVNREEIASAPFPVEFEAIKATGVEFGGKKYAIRVSPLDCTGCNACVEACPETPKALEMQDINIKLEENKSNWDYAYSSLPERGNAIDKYSIRGSQFQTPLMEFSGACSGCGETPYFKLLTQLFGERMVIANATGCSSIWGASFPSNPYTVSKKTGRGPAWANSLFEDNAEYGLGMFSAMQHRRERLIQQVENYVHEMELKSASEKGAKDSELASLLHDWLEVREEKSDKCTLLFDKMKPLFQELVGDTATERNDGSLLSKIWSDRDMFPKLSQWICGGDGWAYDIGFGGLDHVEAFEANDVNVLVVDTEMYSNTGGQCSKATPAGASVNFAIGGKTQSKKNIGEIFMTYEHVYVASVCLANQAQVLQAFIEADQHQGPSFIVAYSPCVQQGIRSRGLDDMVVESRFAVDSGYWPLYRYNPKLRDENKNPFILDSKKLRKEVTAFLQRETRFMSLQKKHPEIAEELFAKMNTDVSHRMEHLNQLAAGYKAFGSEDEAPVKVLFASETGTAARVARDFADACVLSHIADAMDDIEMDDIEGKTTIFFIATCGQGAMPQNGKNFYKELCDRKEPFKEGTRFSIMGLGDSSYYFYCKAATDVETRLIELGAAKLLDLGHGDDSAEEGLEEGLHDWLYKIWPALEVEAPKEVPHITPVKVEFSPKAILRPEEEQKILNQYYQSDGINAKNIPILGNDKMCREDYNRDFRTLRLNSGHDLNYGLGDALEIFPRNDPDKVTEFINAYSPDYDDRTVVKIHAFGINGEVSLGTLFTYVLDLFGKPSKHFMQQLATFVTDEKEKTTMIDLNFLTEEGKKSAITMADCLLRFKKAHPPLPILLAIIPTIKPRAYSIASAPLASPSVIELLVLIDTWWCNDGLKTGLTCSMLRDLKSGDHLWCRTKAGSMDPPEPEQAVICAGIGSGLAPHMAFLRDKVRAVNAGEKVGRFSLYFGNRFKADEYLYQAELEKYEKLYDWFQLHSAFSRDDPKKKVYVQDLVAQTDDARQLLREDPNGMLYVCGNRNLPKPLQDSLIQSFSQRSKDTAAIEAAAQVMEDLYIHGRAQQEVW